MKLVKKISLIVISLILLISGYELLRRHVGGFAGSYPFAESWEVKMTMAEIEHNLEKLHEKNPAIFFDKNNLVLEVDRTGYWKKVDFFYKERNDIVKVLIREFDGYTLISLVSFTNQLSGEIKLMNKDYNWFENKKEKDIFESKILKYLSRVQSIE